jgi:hypothetical protein
VIVQLSSEWSNIEFSHQLDRVLDDSLTLFRPINLGKHKIEFYNCDFKIQGKLLTTYDPLDIKVVNATFDYDYANWGFVAEVQCNYPGVRLDGELFFKNNTVYSGN